MTSTKIFTSLCAAAALSACVSAPAPIIDDDSRADPKGPLTSSPRPVARPQWVDCPPGADRVRVWKHERLCFLDDDETSIGKLTPPGLKRPPHPEPPEKPKQCHQKERGPA